MIANQVEDVVYSIDKKLSAEKTLAVNESLSTTSSVQCALLTVPGRSAVAVIGVRGRRAYECVRCCFRPATNGEWRTGQVRFGKWGCQENDGGDVAGEEVVVVPVAGDCFEIHSHGGIAAPNRIMRDLRDNGADEIDTEAWGRVGGSQELIVEAESVLARCTTSRMAAVALDQVRGALLDWACTQLGKLESGTAELATIQSDAAAVWLRAEFGLRIAGRFLVVLLGPPNVGKSSLINALLGYQRSITMDMPGTTRDVLEAETVLDGIPIRLADTAGIRNSNQQIEQQGVAKAGQVASQADLVILVTEPGIDFLSPPERVRVLRVQNKSDLGGEADLIGGDTIIKTVATSGEGIDRLSQAIVENLVMFPPTGAPVPLNGRQARLLGRLQAARSLEASHEILSELVYGQPSCDSLVQDDA